MTVHDVRSDRSVRGLITGLGLVVIAGCSSASAAPVGENARLEPGQRRTFEIYGDCGVGSLGKVNGIWWVADAPGGDRRGWFPDAWDDAPSEERQSLDVRLELSIDGEVITATFNDESATYRPTNVIPKDIAPSNCD